MVSDQNTHNNRVWNGDNARLFLEINYLFVTPLKWFISNYYSKKKL